MLLSRILGLRSLFPKVIGFVARAGLSRLGNYRIMGFFGGENFQFAAVSLYVKMCRVGGLSCHALLLTFLSQFSVLV